MRKLLVACLAVTLLGGGCTDRPMHETETERLWRNPCAWETATRSQRSIRVAEIAVQEERVGEDDVYARVAARELARCREASR